MTNKDCPVCNEEIESGRETSIFVTNEMHEKGISPSEVVFDAREETSYTICQTCFDKGKHIKD